GVVAQLERELSRRHGDGTGGRVAVGFLGGRFGGFFRRLLRGLPGRFLGRLGGRLGGGLFGGGRLLGGGGRRGRLVAAVVGVTVRGAGGEQGERKRAHRDQHGKSCP